MVDDVPGIFSTEEGHSHQVTVELKKEDLLKLKYVMVYDGESVPQNWSVENVIRHVRRIDLDPLMVCYCVQQKW